MLSGEKWEEGVRKGDGRFYLTAEDADEKALEILLNIIHLKNRRVSRRLDLEMLARIAVLVDYYECAEAVEIFSSIWYPQTAADLEKVPQTICRELMLCLCVSYTFRLSELFERVTTIALKESKMRALPTLDLPVVHVLATIDKKRLVFLANAAQKINDEFARYMSPAYVCKQRNQSSDACRFMLYGAMVAQTKDAGLLNGVLRDPDTTLSLEEVRKKIVGFNIPVWYSEGRYEHHCNLDDFKKYFKSLSGLRLESFVKAD